MPNPEQESNAYVGLSLLQHYRSTKNFGEGVIIFFREFFRWTAIISLGVGLFNLLPISFLDGGRMIGCLFVDDSLRKKVYFFSNFFTIILIFATII